MLASPAASGGSGVAASSAKPTSIATPTAGTTAALASVVGRDRQETGGGQRPGAELRRQRQRDRFAHGARQRHSLERARYRLGEEHDRRDAREREARSGRAR